MIGSTLAKLSIQYDDVDYLAKYLQSKFTYLRDKCTGATIPHISKHILISLQIPLPPLPVQRKIVEVLNKAQSLIDMRKEQIELLDKLIQSTFYDMFGDPVNNDMGWEETTIGGACYFVKDGPHKSLEYCDDGIPFVFVKDILILQMLDI